MVFTYIRIMIYQGAKMDLKVNSVTKADYIYYQCP